ncbi:bifunctional proline dehydrogenase/L-glutamate gamma-semialdehyde dehydrogenase [Bacteroides pyogenes]|uniref:bifunctional proline dehydrogenase/L-glutamate gamma-semialdehyde dehydrogenase n=1 Tax=Bacteroides pyogenes TaxID=310300 RepID=UPI001BAC6331|nr:bifunctional proline dehydrogenase/L-glutamate gamma-semialdehyde dehydrogenase [Bacteroides pyogenes]MBR8725921.1 1-pyrroline-5-carboxylate dehydrogenase [Bacteroides pyogenes]MBR8739201.1 1-pyrroline-5-carboxylate dehydrogenase [Bacteroides pyogenes]MBR8755119.1 1-pyrroline-5-carboxylate dehydrogenase [Bacteroides pyogenes]MBR8796390.1 1-pyrroline-5-carboxylate dehydrogenase [Bacteroides pyogenes]MBR8809914.1 1-pyrroline-5-carboxylate dehydrogenase [Bacteroides pyogenes]
MENQNKPTFAEVQEWVLKLYHTCEQTITEDERREQQKYAVMVQRPQDKKFLVKMLDESSQIRDRKVLARRIKTLIDRYGVPRFLNRWDTFLFKMYQAFGHHFDFIAIPIIKRRLRSDTSKVIIDEARPQLTEHLAARFKEKIGQNVNLLGEVVLGNAEADHRYHHYLEALEAPDINYISVKISGIYAQTHALNYEESFPELISRMSALYQKAIDFPYTDEEGVRRHKFINLDMEEYKDAHLTLRLFKAVLSLPQFKNYSAGIVVQAYLPDAYDFQTELLEFAKARVEAGGAPVKMRLVKGANLEMETVVSSLRGWPNPIRPSKTEVDANYLHLLERALLPENARALHLGVASHNLFSIAYAHLLAQRNGTARYMTFEMLEGMANHLWRAQSMLGNRVILYTPVVKDEHFLNAVSYLVRRMDENTAPDNFLTHSFNLKPGTKEWDFLAKQFEDAYAMKDSLTHVSPRTQNRNKPYTPVPPSDTMKNEPDTDFDLVQNQEWVRRIFAKWKKSPEDKPEIIPLQIGADTVVCEKRHRYFDRCQNDEVCVCEMSQADSRQVEEIVRIAESDPAGWRQTTLEERHRIMYDAANRLAEMRGDLIGCMCAVTGKTVLEGDVEVSEAVDYARFYTTAMKEFAALEGVEMKPKGTILVISPWNFPCAIPVGGVSAALSGGNTVILKPATVAAPVAWMFAKAFWDAGVPKEALQVIITDREALNKLTSSPAVKHIILTGGTDTAQRIAGTAPSTPLSAETGGKNAIILTASGDRDHAIMNIVASAFGNAGQKCSACSLLLVERSVYESENFRSKLKDAATSLKTGSVWNAGNIVGPMITDRNEKLLHAFMLDRGESWLVPPRFIDEKKYILAPTVKWGVRPENFSFRTELFGPLLSVACIDSLQEGIELVNGLDYGLTSGLQSLDESEQKQWKNSIQAGNLYINRGITGAIVNRQPFGGMKLSAFGGGVKAGGPNYCACFVTFADKPDSATGYRESYAQAYRNEFSRTRDINKLYGEQNLFRYLPLKSMVLRLFPEDRNEEAEMIALAANTCGTPLTISFDPNDDRTEALRTTGCTLRKESAEEFLKAMPEYERIRTCSPNIPRSMYERAAETNLYIATAPPVKEGRVELIHYIREQSISFEYHRYGSISEVPPCE